MDRKQQLELAQAELARSIKTAAIALAKGEDKITLERGVVADLLSASTVYFRFANPNPLGLYRQANGEGQSLQ